MYYDSYRKVKKKQDTILTSVVLVNAVWLFVRNESIRLSWKMTNTLAYFYKVYFRAEKKYLSSKSTV
jgi:hypothetical protein